MSILPQCFFSRMLVNTRSILFTSTKCRILDFPNVQLPIQWVQNTAGQFTLTISRDLGFPNVHLPIPLVPNTVDATIQAYIGAELRAPVWRAKILAQHLSVILNHSNEFSRTLIKNPWIQRLMSPNFSSPIDSETVKPQISSAWSQNLRWTPI